MLGQPVARAIAACVSVVQAAVRWGPVDAPLLLAGHHRLALFLGRRRFAAHLGHPIGQPTTSASSRIAASSSHGARRRRRVPGDSPTVRDPGSGVRFDAGGLWAALRSSFSLLKATTVEAARSNSAD